MIIEDNTKIFIDQLKKITPELLVGVGNEAYKSIYNFMTEDKIVDTGRLRGSLSYSTDGYDYNQPTLANYPTDFIKGVTDKDAVIIGSNVEYASFVNSGTSKQRARKFMQVGITRAVPQIKKVVKIILQENF